MDIPVIHTDLGTGVLTTDHAASSYGQPVLVVDGRAYGPNDTVAVPDGFRSIDRPLWVGYLHRVPDRAYTAQELADVHRLIVDAHLHRSSEYRQWVFGASLKTREQLDDIESRLGTTLFRA